MKSHSFKQPVTEGQFELEIKRSRFIVHWCPLHDKNTLATFVQRWKTQFPDARHHCWAYCLGHPDNALTMGCNDDGEPSGTAGRPMLNAIVQKGVGNIAVVVIRYFGGIKLGAGGLIRAYAGSVSQALDSAEYVLVEPMHSVCVCGDFSLEQPLRYWLTVHQGQMDEVSYGQQVHFDLRCPVGLIAEFDEWLAANGAAYVG